MCHPFNRCRLGRPPHPPSLPHPVTMPLFSSRESSSIESDKTSTFSIHVISEKPMAISGTQCSVFSPCLGLSDSLDMHRSKRQRSIVCEIVFHRVSDPEMPSYGEPPTGMWRRYSEFELLRSYLEIIYPAIVVPPLPEKRVSVSVLYNVSCITGM